MTTPLRVVWFEGLFMTPQHLQQQERYYEHLIGSRLTALSRDSWGVRRLVINERALQQGQVVVESFEGIMPDGLPLEISGSEAPPPRPIDTHFAPIDQSMDLYLAVPQTREGVANVARDRDPRVRWFRSGQVTHDLLADAEPLEVEYARPVVVLLFGDEPREGYDAIKVAEVVRADAGGFALSHTYVPPCLHVAASAFVLSGLRRLLGAMTARRANLVQAQHEQGEGVEYNASDITRFLLLNAISAYVPVIDHFAESGDLSPRALYLALIELAGHLSVFAKDYDPGSVPKFAFNDLRATFEPLFALITYLLQATVRDQFVGMALDSRDDGMHLGQMQDEGFLDCSAFVLGVRSKVTGDDVQKKLPRLSKIASWQDINSILSAATPGVPVEHTLRPPPQIPTKVGTTYFVINTKNQYWQNIMLERRLAVYLPEPFYPSETTVSLLGVLRGTKRAASPGNR
jgi:type VI secretion system protein ImpJ